MALDVKVTIEKEKIVQGLEDGIPLIWAGFQSEVVPYTECATPDEVAALVGQDSRASVAATRIFGQSSPPAKVAVYGGTGAALDEDGLPAVWEENWRQLVLASEEGENTESGLVSLAAYFEAWQDKVVFTRVRELSEVSGEGKSIMGYSRLFCLFHPGSEEMVEAAVVGASAGKAMGAITYKNMMLTGVSPAELTDNQLRAAHNLGCVCIVRKAGDVVTSEGIAADGEFLDILDARDWVIREIVYRTQKTLNANDKVPFDNNGIALLESVAVEVLENAWANGLIAADPGGNADYKVDYQPRSATAKADRAARRYVEGRFNFVLAGAVHTAEIHGLIEI